MDNLLLDYGAHDMSVFVEDVAEPGHKPNVDAKEALVAAVSDMSRRSRAIRLLVDSPSPNALRPRYILRSSTSQGDNQAQALDLTLLAAQDLTVIPGVASRNQATPLEAVKFGHSFGLGGDAAQARRALTRLGAIEVFGRLAKLPYWTCLGGSADQPEVAAEVRDWYEAMAARPQEIIEYFQQQLSLRGVYDGPQDGSVNPRFKESVARYREALGLSREPKLSKEFLQAYLGADHRELLARLKPGALPPASSPPQEPLRLSVAAANDASHFSRGENIQLHVRTNRDAHVYCFLQDENKRVLRFFPNRFQPAARVKADEGLQLPGAMRFEIRLNTRGVTETVACFATDRDVLAELPAALGAAADFAPLPVASLGQVRDAFGRVGGSALAQETLQMQPR